jgi:universal stress protein E
VIQIRTIFAVIDPTTGRQRGLERAVAIAKAAGAVVRAYLCVHSGLESANEEELKAVELERYGDWLAKVVSRIDAGGVEITPEVEWTRDWRTAIGPAAERVGADLIVKPTYRRSRSRRLLMTTSDWSLFRGSKSSILLVTAAEATTSNVVLIAVDVNRDNDEYRNILDAVIQYGKAAAASMENGELHAVQAYEEQAQYAHVTDVARRTGIDAARVHVAGGKPEEAIAKVAGKISAGLVIMGVSTQATLKNRVFGYTAEWLMNSLNQDILVVQPAAAVQQPPG